MGGDPPVPSAFKGSLWQADMSFACLPLTLTLLLHQKGAQFCCLFFFTPLSWENLPELIHRSQHMNFQSGISRIFQCGSSFVNLASIACVVGIVNVNRIWSLGQGIASLISKKDLKNGAHFACSVSVMFLQFEEHPLHKSTKNPSLSRHGCVYVVRHFALSDKGDERNWNNTKIKDLDD